MVLHLFCVVFGSNPPSCTGAYMAWKGEVWGFRYCATTLYQAGQIAVGVLYLGGGGKKAIFRQAKSLSIKFVMQVSTERNLVLSE